MPQETIRNIKNAELKAQQVLREAEAEKTALLKSAREKSAAYKTELTGRANEHAKAAVAAVEATRADALEKAEVRAEAVIAGFKKDITEKREAAIEAVIAEIV